MHSIVPRKVHKSLQTVFVFSARANGVWPARLLRGRGGDMSGFVRLLLVNCGPRGGAFEIC